MAPQSGYLLVMGTALDQDRMDRYQKIIPSIYASFEGYRLVMGAPPADVTFLAGGLREEGVMLARFPSPGHVSGFWWSEEYRKAYAVRENAGRFAAIALPGLNGEVDPLPGSRSYLVAMATPDDPERWRHFAAALGAGLQAMGATILADANSEAIERLEGSMPGSYVLVAMMPPGQDAATAWAALEADVDFPGASRAPAHVLALEGLPDDHPERLTG
jgi:uncharacterized protein (DUF1330 family)